MTWRWGIIGPGGIAERFARDVALVDDAVITAVASRSSDRARSFADRHGIAAHYGDSRELLDDPEVDVVYVATPNSRHAPDTIAALASGKHVLCEKPLALTPDEASEMVAAAKHAGVFLMEAMWTRFLPSYRSLIEVLTDGRIGEPLLVEGDLGFRADFDPSHRLFDPTLGGGATLDLGIYPVQLCSLVLGRPDRVSADVTVGPTGVDELAAAVLHHPGGGLGVIKTAIRVGMSCQARIAGTDGWIDIPEYLHCPTHLDVHGPDGRERIDTTHDGDGIRFQVHEVHRCLDAGETESPIMPLHESIEIAATLDIIRRGATATFAREASATDGLRPWMT